MSTQPVSKERRMGLWLRVLLWAAFAALLAWVWIAIGPVVMFVAATILLAVGRFFRQPSEKETWFELYTLAQAAALVGLALNLWLLGEPCFAAFVLGLGAVAAWVIHGAAQATRERLAALARATPASARVLAVQSFGSQQKSGIVHVRLKLEVQPQTGGAYEAQMDWSVPPKIAPQLQLGQRVAVKIDADDPKLIYASEAWADETTMIEKSPEEEAQPPPEELNPPTD